MHYLFHKASFLQSKKVLLFLYCCIFFFTGNSVSGEDLIRVRVSSPGPRNISYLPIDLIPAIGADRDEGLDVQLIHTGGGAVALNHLVTRNADFAVAGVPAAMSLRANGGDVVVIAPVNDTPLFVLMVRSDLKNSVRKIADLRGRVIGVNTSTKSSKTTSQQLVELLLKSGGISTDEVRIVPAGQSWIEQSSLMISGAADAVMGDEPFASRMLLDGKVFFLAHLAEPGTIKGIKGAGFLHAAVETRSDLIKNEPEKVKRFIRCLQKTLIWISKHSPEEIVARLNIKDTQEKQSLILSLRKYPRSFSKDGLFSQSQLKETEVFFRSTVDPGSSAYKLNILNMVNTAWAGIKQ